MLIEGNGKNNQTSSFSDALFPLVSSDDVAFLGCGIPGRRGFCLFRNWWYIGFDLQVTIQKKPDLMVFLARSRFQCSFGWSTAPLVFVVGGVRRTVRGQRQCLDVVAHVRSVAARTLRVQKRHGRVSIRVHIKPCNRRR
uniref:Uncharacterized protein n=1 Tax=Schizaphis graminum TaxID=13262 RepID=A0A2S2PS02_SCHGA